MISASGLRVKDKEEGETALFEVFVFLLESVERRFKYFLALREWTWGHGRSESMACSQYVWISRYRACAYKYWMGSKFCTECHTMILLLCLIVSVYYALRLWLWYSVLFCITFSYSSNRRIGSFLLSQSCVKFHSRENIHELWLGRPEIQHLRWTLGNSYLSRKIHTSRTHQAIIPFHTQKNPKDASEQAWFLVRNVSAGSARSSCHQYFVAIFPRRRQIPERETLSFFRTSRGSRRKSPYNSSTRTTWKYTDQGPPEMSIYTASAQAGFPIREPPEPIYGCLAWIQGPPIIHGGGGATGQKPRKSSCGCLLWLPGKTNHNIVERFWN